MAVLVTGASGFIGSNIARTLLDQGETVVGYDVAPPPPHTVLGPMAGKYTFVIGSVHSGFTSGPYMGKLLSQLILGNEPERPLFDIGRLLATS